MDSPGATQVTLHISLPPPGIIVSGCLKDINPWRGEVGRLKESGLLYGVRSVVLFFFHKRVQSTEYSVYRLGLMDHAL